jgi:tRNA (guanine37-N1)-methyltransferase
MKISIGTLFPKLYSEFLSSSIIGKAAREGKIIFDLINVLDFYQKERVDAPIAGHGPGMLLKADAIKKTVEKVEAKSKNKKVFKIFFSPHGKTLNQDLIKRIKNKTQKENLDLLLIAGRYEGCDARAEDKYADEIISVGNFVTMGGDLPAMIFIESLVRLLPGIVGNVESIEQDSFCNNLIDSAHYVNPDIWEGVKIPEVLKSGNHKQIEEWRKNNSLKRTLIDGHFNWWRNRKLSEQEKNDAKQTIPNHYCILLHNDVVMPDGQIGESSVTSIDIHDISRSASTYGIRGAYIVTRLDAQQKLVNNFLDFWHKGRGTEANENRAFAIKNTKCLPEIDDVLSDIEKDEGKKPICIVTSSRRNVPHENMLNYSDQSKIWKQNRPVIFIFGTAHGISNELMKNLDYKLIPIDGLEKFNFLSVRSAAAIIFDRWLGLKTTK